MAGMFSLGLTKRVPDKFKGNASSKFQMAGCGKAEDEV